MIGTPPHGSSRAWRAVEPPSALKPGEHGQHTAVVGLRGRQAELHEDVRNVLLDRAVGDHERLRDRAVRAALRHQPEHVALTWRELVERRPRAAAAEQLRDRLWVECGAALGHAANRIDEVARVRDALLE